MITLREKEDGGGSGGGAWTGGEPKQGRDAVQGRNSEVSECLLEEYHLERPELHEVRIQRRAAQENACRETEEMGEGRRKRFRRM